MPHLSMCSNWMLRKTCPVARRLWCLWKSSLHSSVVRASPDVGSGEETSALPSFATENPPHTPVMLNEVLHHLDLQPCQVVLDMTFGGGGHTKEILSANSKVTVLALDRDPAAIALAQKLEQKHRQYTPCCLRVEHREYQCLPAKAVHVLRSHFIFKVTEIIRACNIPNAVLNVDSSGRVKPVLGRFSEVESLLAGMDVKPGSIDAVLLDAGCSSMQMDEARRGFALSKDGPLDMRMDGERYPDMACAADVVNTLDQHALTSILTAYGEETRAWKIASAIVEARRVRPITRTQQLAEVIAGSFPAAALRARKDRLQRPAHVATKTFQALRIFVNDELRELHAGLRAAQTVLRPGGRLCVLTFHSLEDRLVKRFLQGDDLSNVVESHFCRGTLSKAKERSVEESCKKKSTLWMPVEKKVITPEKFDVEKNPRGRSAKLRVALRL